MPEITLGIFPGIGGTQILPRVLGAPLARELIFTGRRMPAAEAHAAGMVNHVVPAGAARAQALAIAATISRIGPVAEVTASFTATRLRRGSALRARG